MSDTNGPDTPTPTTPPAPTKRFDYVPPPSMTRLRRWARDTFSREQLVSGLKQFAWVAPLTLLIWVYAEREQTTSRDIRFTVELSSNNPNVDVRLVEPYDGWVSADCTGPRARLDEIRSELGTRASPVRFEVPADLKVGEHQVPVSAVVNRDPRFDGVGVKGSEPGRITVYVDAIETDLVPVELREEDKKLYDQVSFTPERVKVRMPKKVKDRAGKLVVYANLSAVADKTPGRKNNVPDVRVHVANTTEDDGVKVEPGTVTASFTVRQADDIHVIKELAVSYGGTGSVLEKVKADYEPSVLFDVKVAGPRELIDQIRQNEKLVEAWLTIEDGDEDVGKMSKVVWFKLPPGVKVHPDDEKRSVEVTVTSRAAAGS
jgi:hypothetical protein